MNIFAIDRDPAVAARHAVDSHTSKMVLESAQMLANCFSKEQLASESCPRTQSGTIRKYSYYNHPCSKWVRESRKNMAWLIEHAFALEEERAARLILRITASGKKQTEEHSAPHFSLPFIQWVKDNLSSSIVPEGELTEFAQAMPDEYKCVDSVQAYRNLYRHGKAHLHKWTRNKPDWI